jgi:hypothetical protein
MVETVVPFPVRLRRFRFRDPTALPRRPWLVRGLILRGHITALLAAGGVGKSVLSLTLALHMCSGKHFGPWRASERLRVAVLTVEEDEDELDRRLHALQIQYGFDNDDASRLLIINMDDPPLLAMADKRGNMQPTKKLADLKIELANHGADVIILDPFVELWAGQENDNVQVRSAMGYIRSICRELNVGCILCHHIRKGLMTPGDVDAGRGASAFAGLVRMAFTITPMTKQEADQFDLEKYKGIIRIDSAKGNYSTADVDDATWLKFRTIDLENYGEDNEDSDKVGVLVTWSPPGVFEGIGFPAIDKVLDKIEEGPEEGERWSFAPQAKDAYVGLCIAEGLEITSERAERVISTWKKSGLLYEKEVRSPKVRKMRARVFVDESKRPSAIPQEG